MKRLPLRFAQKDESNIVFVKVYDSVSSTGDRPRLSINEGKNYSPMDMIIIISSLFIAVILVIVAVFGIVIYKCRVWSYGRILDEEFCEDIAPIIFSYQEIEKLADCFKEKIGRGSSGTVYKRTMVNHQKFVAIKRLDNVLAEGEREFLTEIKVIGRTHHRNLVRLLGYSFDGPNKVLVYEYMSNGSLADILFAPIKQCNWIERIDIAHDIARGILYLHDECEMQNTHCDIKPQSILMDDSKCAKKNYFGLAKLMKPDQTKTFIGIRGTRGYVTSERHRKLPMTVKVDVYSFEVVLLQIICCRRSMDQNLLEDQVTLEDWAYQCFDSRDLSQLIGDEEVELKQLGRMVEIAL
ncbi:hypothetical protein Pint_19525 [Pistacia integerrima]|uniref:Uncharacterized protein n=1 Tax=Pistacia integerrima TaxID=434235 RepID=A0ACC0XE91_9ROSI|nr:hypothetical protein Pint_19525 [Pistacia integerrima]